MNGHVQEKLLRRAVTSKLGLVYVKDYREMRSARMLVRRGLLLQLGLCRSRTFLHVSELERER